MDVDDRQKKLYSWLSTTAKESCILGGCNNFLAKLQFGRCPTLLRGQSAKKIIHGGRQPRKLNFLGSLFLADFAWRLAAKDYFFGDFGIFFGGFWPPRQFWFGVVPCHCLSPLPWRLLPGRCPRVERLLDGPPLTQGACCQCRCGRT